MHYMTPVGSKQATTKKDGTHTHADFVLNDFQHGFFSCLSTPSLPRLRGWPAFAKKHILRFAPAKTLIPLT